MTNDYNIIDALGFRFKKEIAEGTDGTVIKAENIYNNARVAIKLVTLNSSLSKMRFNREAVNSIALRTNPNIATTRSLHQKGDIGVIVMDYYHCEDLMSYFLREKAIPEAKVRNIFRQMCTATKFCHSKNIAHLDIKPDNFLYDEITNLVYLCDFYRSVDFSNSELDASELNNATTLYYRAPETFQEKKMNNWAKVDVWSLGICLFGLLFGFFPFEVTFNPLTLKDVVVFDFLRFEDFMRCGKGANLSREVKDLIRHMLEPNPLRRYSMAEVVDHPFFFSVYN